MSIRLIARDLYRLKREVESLENEAEGAPVPMRAALEERLRQARAEYRRMRQVLEGAKEPPISRRPR
jgi:hypothetical protein